MLHFIHWNYRLRAGKQFVGKKALSIENTGSRNKTKLVSKRLAHFSAQI
jgi:hypothetical protein